MIIMREPHMGLCLQASFVPESISLWSESQWLELILILSLMLEEQLFEQVELT